MQAAVTDQQETLERVLAGPLLRRITAGRMTFWLAASQPLELSLSLYPASQEPQVYSTEQLQKATRVIQAGERLYFYLVDLPLSSPLPQGERIDYDLRVNGLAWQDWAEDLVYPGQEWPGFVVQPRLNNLLHGSCRKPHHDSGDGLWRADRLLEETPPEDWPSLLMMSGDQIYADDVAGPLLAAIHELLAQLELPEEKLPEAEITSSQLLHQQQPHYYHREDLLPKTRAGRQALSQVFGGVHKPIFTADHAHNHLITLGEVLGMYLLVWSPAGWKGLTSLDSAQCPPELSSEQAALYAQEQQALRGFTQGLNRVRRVLAHLPVAMIFDDHDITDDWNLTAAWEEAAYGQAFSRRILGNALLGYWICQGWGNAPENFPEELGEEIAGVVRQPGGERHDELAHQLLRFPKWHYQWDTQPPLLVMDTRTHRWRSEISPDKPSGLMDWEALTDLQHELLEHQAVVLVSPAPMFGVKLIEGVQRLFTWAGQPLMVDAENWMAHPGSAYALMNLFRHPRTPQNFVILSGDVHYSFVYDIELRGRERGPDIFQITSSGIKNEFPRRLLDWFDRLNRWLYAPRSPLNWLTKRRRMKIIPRKPEQADSGERLLNAAGLGWVELAEDGRPKKVVQLCADGRDISFYPQKEAARWE
ncbi:alkaline phosphatase D family protein [Marinospirillum perlucidum]|uniref:alkaline phosphatase D family protein n=1 Tax=Marinospirillum perlucidum TaxID=1982602 RepID=UPI000DF1DF47|nr:alkaline phosphatase D family protein [Marinospirillum perlucidum]